MKTSRRRFCGRRLGAGRCVVRFELGVRAEEVRRRRHRHRDQDRQHQPLQRPGLGLRRDRQDDRGLLEERQRGRRHQRPQGQLHHRSTTATARPRRSRSSASWSSRKRCFACSNTLGTPSNTAIHKYMNQKKVPQLFVATGASKWGKPKEFPWTMGFQPDYHTEGVIYAKHILANVKDAKIAVLHAERRLRQGLSRVASRKAWARRPARIVKHVTYEATDPTVDSQIIQLKDSGANVFFNIDDAQGRGAGHPQGGRHRLEAGALPEQRLGLGRRGHEARRLRQRPGHHHGGLHHGRHRQGLGQQRRDEGLARLDGQEHADGQQGRRQPHLRLCRRRR